MLRKLRTTPYTSLASSSKGSPPPPPEPAPAERCSDSGTLTDGETFGRTAPGGARVTGVRRCQS